MFPKEDKLNAEMAREWSSYFPWLHQTSRPNEFNDDDVNEFVATRESIHASIRSVGKTAFEKHVFELLGRYVEC